jgi:hypothetical protein
MRPCEKIAVCATVFFGIISVWYVKTTQRPVQPCAESCSCTPEDTDWESAVNVQCGDRNLRSVPSTINDQPVYLLNVSFNVLRTLEENALFSYESVRYLYLYNCKIVNINEKAFGRLENLTEIDLAYNRLTSISPNLFNGNQKMNKLILRRNNLDSLEWNTPILNGPSSLSFLDLQSCKLSNISSITFSLLPNLIFLDISRNNLVLLHNDSLSSHEKLKDVNLENNPWQCGVVFQRLICWIHSKLVPSYNRKVKCQYLNGTWDIWSPQNWSSLCDSETTRSVTSSQKPGISTSTEINLVSTPSHELDISTKKTLNSTLSHTEQPGTNNALWGLLIFTVLFLFGFALALLLYCACKKNSTPDPTSETDPLHTENANVEDNCQNTL